jgi:hypothetical protein
VTYDLGNVNTFYMTSLPSGAVFGKQYGWSVRVYNGSDSYGEAYYYRTVTFQSSAARTSVSMPERPMREGPTERDLQASER